jgi:hypothetical protein
MSVAIADAFRYVATSGTNAGEVDGTITAPGVLRLLQILQTVKSPLQTLVTVQAH